MSTLAGANYLFTRFLERFNRQFAVAPAQSRTAYRSLDPDLDVDQVHCFRHSRRVARDNTVRYDWQVAGRGGIIPSQLVPPKPGLMRLRISWNASLQRSRSCPR